MNTVAAHAFCQFTKVDGEPCRAHPVDRSAYCFTHDPASAARRQAARRAGGAARNRKAVLDPKDAPDIPLDSPTQIVAFLTSTIHQLRRGEIDPSLGRVLCSLTNTLLKAISLAYQEPFSPLGDILLRNNLIYDAKARDADDEMMARREAERQSQEQNGQHVDTGSDEDEQYTEEEMEDDDEIEEEDEEQAEAGGGHQAQRHKEKNEDDIEEKAEGEAGKDPATPAPTPVSPPAAAAASTPVIPDPPAPPPPAEPPKMEGFCLHTLAACTRPRRDGAFDVEIEFEAERFIRNFQGELVPAPLCHRIDVIVYGIPEEGKPDGAVVGRPRVPIYTSRSRHVFSVPIRPYKTAIYCTPDGPLTLEFKQLELKEMNPSWF